MEMLLGIKEAYWAHRQVSLIVGGIGLVALAQVGLVLWIGRALGELSHMRERMSRLADGLALLTDTTEAGLAALVQQSEMVQRRRAPAKANTRSTVAKRVVEAARLGADLSRIAEQESLSESEVRLHLSMAASKKHDIGELSFRA